MWLVLSYLYKVAAFPISLALQAAMVIGWVMALFGGAKLFFVPWRDAIGLILTGGALCAVATIAYVLVNTVAAHLDDKHMDSVGAGAWD